ncbi:uncharacterized protein LOC124148817 [Haliotis rufescens]|uniref:uncharacterized protein LOC124148817 n=1 Tax=Haliotis rufescens TaxID=6454 RepID=UPI00201F26EF|nr:uncharacterized protein LOC124148817 [Haliotis rufescens]
MMTNPGKTHCVLRTPVKPNWIQTVLWGVVAAIVGFNSVACLTCTSSDLMSIQEPCRAENDELVKHIGTNHSSQLCNALHKLWFCVAKNVPRCFHNMTAIHQAFTHSPHNCRMGRDDFLKIQEIIRENEKNGGTSPTPTTTATPSPPPKGGNEDDPGYTVGHQGGQPNSGGSVVKSCDHVTYLLLSLLILVHTLPVTLPVL